MTHVLIVEDDSFLASAYKSKLTNSGYEVTVASNGKEALSSVLLKKPDVVLLDLVMPEMDGFETLKQLRANPKWEKIPIIVATNLGQDEDKEKAKKLGANDFIEKSHTPLAQIIEAIEKIAPHDSEPKK